MSRVKIFSLLLALVIVSGCRKENFVEPPDPFEPATLDPEHEAITLGEGSNALTLLVNNNSFKEKGNKAQISGSFFVHNEFFGDLRVFSGDFQLTKNESGNFIDFNGFGRLEFPNEGPFSALGIEGIVGRKIGFQKGGEFDLDDFPWPVNPDRYYFYVDTEEGFDAKIHETKLKGIKRIALDPTDPYLFVNAVVEKKGEEVGEFGVAFSAQKKIPFYPVVTEYTLSPFLGEFYLSGEVPVKRFSVTLWGEAVFSFGEGAADSYFSGENSVYTMGANGKVLLDNEALDWLDIDVELGRASLELDVHDDGYTQLKFVGLREDPPMTPSEFMDEIIGASWDFVDNLYPYEQKEIFYGTLGSNPDEWEIGFDIDSRMKILDYDIDMGNIHLYVTSHSLEFAGSMPVNVIGRIGVSGNVRDNGEFSFSGYGSAGFDVSAGPLSLHGSIGMNLSLAYADATLTITGRVHLNGGACAEILGAEVCVDFGIDAWTTIRSDGYFEVCFSIGIDGVGFDVCLEFKKENMNGNEIEFVEMTQRQIPIEQVPVENRFYSENYRGVR